MSKVAEYRRELLNVILSETIDRESAQKAAAKLACEIDAHMPGLSHRASTVASLIDKGWYDTAADVALTFIPGK